MVIGHLTALPFSHKSNKCAYLLTIRSRDRSGRLFSFWVLFYLYLYFYFSWLSSNLYARVLNMLGYYLIFLEELLPILFKLWGMGLFFVERWFLGVWLRAFFPVRLRPLQFKEDPFNYLDFCFVGVFIWQLTDSEAFYRLRISLRVWSGLLSTLVAFLLIWDLLICSLGLGCLLGLGYCGGSVRCWGVLVDFNDTLAVQFSFPSWKQMLFLIRNCMNSALWPSDRLANSTVLVVYFFRII